MSIDFVVLDVVQLGIEDNWVLKFIGAGETSEAKVFSPALARESVQLFFAPGIIL
jgi:hypothetical protein